MIDPLVFDIRHDRQVSLFGHSGTSVLYRFPRTNCNAILRMLCGCETLVVVRPAMHDMLFAVWRR